MDSGNRCVEVGTVVSLLEQTIAQQSPLTILVHKLPEDIVVRQWEPSYCWRTLFDNSDLG
jgi:hypothetical protein